MAWSYEIFNPIVKDQVNPSGWKLRWNETEGWRLLLLYSWLWQRPFSSWAITMLRTRIYYPIRQTAFPCPLMRLKIYSNLLENFVNFIRRESFAYMWKKFTHWFNSTCNYYYRKVGWGKQPLLAPVPVWQSQVYIYDFIIMAIKTDWGQQCTLLPGSS